MGNFLVPLTDDEWNLCMDYGITNVYEQLGPYARFYNDPRLVALFAKVMQTKRILESG